MQHAIKVDKKYVQDRSAWHDVTANRFRNHPRRLDCALSLADANILALEAGAIPFPGFLVPAKHFVHQFFNQGLVALGQRGEVGRHLLLALLLFVARGRRLARRAETQPLH